MAFPKKSETTKRGHPATLQRGGAPNTGKGSGEADTLTPPERLFIEHYVLHWNGTKAALAAGYSEKSAYCTSEKLKKRPRVKAAIEAKLAGFKDDYRQSHEALAQFLTNVLYSDLTDILQVEDHPTLPGEKIVNFKASKALATGAGKMFNSITIGKTGIKVEVFSKQAAAEMLAKHVGFYQADNDQRKQDGPVFYIPDNGRDKEDEDPLDSQE